MENQISNLENYAIKSKGSNEDPVQRCRFYYLASETLWKEFDVEGHYDLESAFEYAKNILADDVVQMALKESIKSLDIKSKNFHFIKNGETEDLRDYIFDQDILDNNSDLFKAFKKLLLDNWNEDIVWYYFRADAAKNANIHDDTDKKTVYNHYFDELKEFNDKISFLEYYDTINVDWYETRSDRGINYSFNLYGDYYCIDNTVTRDEIYNFLIKNRIRVSKDIFLNNTLTWGAFAYYYGMNNGLSEIESISFAGKIMKFFGASYSELYRFGLALEYTKNFENIYGIVSLGLPSEFTKNIETDKYFKEYEISELISSVLSNNFDGDGFEHTKEIFMTVFDIYKNHIQNFEYKTKRLEFRVSQRQYDQFMSLPGKSKADKLDSLMEYSKNKIPDSLLTNTSFDEKPPKDWQNYDAVDNYEECRDYDWYEFINPSLERKYGNDFEITIIDSEWGCSSPKEEYLIDNEGFDEVLDMSKARTESDMEWMFNCSGGAPSPKEMKWEWETMHPETKIGILKNSVKSQYKSLSPESLERYFTEMEEAGMSQDELEEFKRYLKEVVDSEDYDYEEKRKKELDEMIKESLNGEDPCKLVDDFESDDSEDED